MADNGKDKKELMLGTILKKAREKKQVSLKELSQKIKIREEYLLNLEEGRFDFLNRPYVLAFVKTYAKALDLDPEEMSKIFSDQIKTQISATLTQGSEDTPGKESQSMENNGGEGIQISQYKKGIILTAAILVLILLIIALQSFFNDPGDSEIITPQNQTETAATPPDTSK